MGCGRGFVSGNLGSGLLTLDGSNLSSDIGSDLRGFSGAENVGACGRNLFDSSDDISLDHILVNCDLFPLLLTVYGSLDVDFRSCDKGIRCPDSLLESCEKSRVVIHDLA